MTIDFGGIRLDPAEFGSQGNAILGIRDSGKTYTATLLAELLFSAGVPFIAFDPIGVWRFLRVPGKGRGFPVVVAGGQEGDLPLSPLTAPAIVEAAMVNGQSLVIDLFDMNLSKADWRRIVRDCVRLLLHRNKEHGLRHIFLEEAAEFAPQKVLDGQVYAEIEKLARMGGNSRLGYTLINQRSQEVNKAVLELCENLFLHRQKGKNALENIKKWLDVSGVVGGEVMRTMPTLPQGECWAWLGGSDVPVHVKVPAKSSYHPDRRAMHGDVGAAKKPVSVDKFVAALQATLPKLEEEAKAGDPKLLRAEIARLTRELAAAQKVNAPAWPDQRAAVAQLHTEGRELRARAAALENVIRAATGDVERLAKTLGTKIAAAPVVAVPASPAPDLPPPPARRALPKAPERVIGAGEVEFDSGDLTPARRTMLDKIRWAAVFFNDPAVPRATLAFLLKKHPRTKSVLNDLGALRTGGYLEYLSENRVQLTSSGEAVAADPGVPLHEDLIAGVKAVLTPRQGEILDIALAGAARGVDTERQDLADNFSLHVRTKSFLNDLGRLRSLGLIIYSGQAIAPADFLKER